MASRFWPRLLVGAFALPRLLLPRKPPRQVRRILIAHHLLLGDTIMLAPLMKKAAARWPGAEILMLCPRDWLPLFAGAPYGVRALLYDRRSMASHLALLRTSACDLALVPADNRWSWIARAMGARWIVGFAPQARSHRDWPVDAFVEFPRQAAAWGDIAATLVDGGFSGEYQPADWPAPPCKPFERPADPYGVLHLGASSPHKLWPAGNWRRIADWARGRGMNIALSAGRSQSALLEEVDPERRFAHFPGTLDLAQLWHLIAGARFLVCPDTGIAHLGRLTDTPTVALFGPGSPVVSGPGRFWRRSRFSAVWIEDIPCRDQSLLFERDLPWVRHCWRTPAECGNPVCMTGIAVDPILAALTRLGVAS